MFNSLSRLFIVIFCITVNYGTFSQTAFLQNGNLRTVFDMAKSQNKPVFIEVYSPDCHICQAFKTTFDNKSVGNAYNSFVSYKLDVGSPEGISFLNKQNIWLPSIPVLLFFDKNVKLNHVAVMSEKRNSSEVLINAAKAALDPQKQTLNYKRRYQNGEREAGFLTEFAMMSKISKDTLMNIEAANAYFKTQKPIEYTNSTNLLVLEKVVMDSENGLFKYMINNLPKYYAVKKDKAKVNSIAENILMYSLYSSRGQNFNSQKIAQIKADLAKVGVDSRSIIGRVWMQEATAYFRENQAAKAMAVIENRLKGTTVGKGEANFLCTFVRSKTADKKAIATANKWCQMAK